MRRRPGGNLALGLKIFAKLREQAVEKVHSPETGELSARTDALMSRAETGKMLRVQHPRLRPIVTRR